MEDDDAVFLLPSSSFLLLMFLKHFPGQFISFSQQQRTIYRCVCGSYLDKPNMKGFVFKSSFFFVAASCLSLLSLPIHFIFLSIFIHVVGVLFGMLASCAKCDSFLLSQSVRWTLIYSDLTTFFYFTLLKVWKRHNFAACETLHKR